MYAWVCLCKCVCVCTPGLGYPFKVISAWYIDQSIIHIIDCTFIADLFTDFSKQILVHVINFNLNIVLIISTYCTIQFYMLYNVI